MKLISTLCGMILASGMTIPVCYEPDFPLDEPGQSSVDSRLLGAWEQEGSENKLMLVVFELNKHEYLLMWDSDDDEAAVARAHSTKVAGVHFMNMQDVTEPSNKRRSRALMRYRLLGDGKLSVTPVSREPLLKEKKFANSRELREFIGKNVKNKSLYGDPIRLKRVGELRIDLSPVPSGQTSKGE
jgi:hypothetical protein